MPIQTLTELFLEVAARDQPDCLQYKVDGQFESISAARLGRRVRRLSAALEAHGITKGDRVALMAENGPHWPVIDFATLCVGAILVPIYPSLTNDQAAYIAADCGARILFVEGRERMDGLLEHQDELPGIELFVSIGDTGRQRDNIVTLDDLIENAEEDEEIFDARARSVRPDELATFIYTSGTTGKPKGVMLTHGNITTNVVAARQVLAFPDDYTALSFLPLSHSFERTVDYCYFLCGVTIAYAESVRTLRDDLLAVRPHVFVSVPRVYEKILAGVEERMGRAGGLRRALFEWAQRVGARALPYRLSGTSPAGWLGLRTRVADRLVFSKIRAALGGRFEFAVSGGAPLARDVAEFFWGAGIRIFEGYGLSETSPVLTVNHQGSVRLGTVGPPIPGVELRIADDGEILARGPNIMQGYYNLEQATADAFDAEGWFRTGDIGLIDEAGHLVITDRKKELIVNAYGKNIAPAPIEAALKASPYIEHALVIGDKRKFLSALLVPDFNALKRWSRARAADRRALLHNEDVRQLIAGHVERVNEDLSSYQQIRAWELLDEEFSIETGELTPTQKVKRRVVRERYARLIDELYEKAEQA